MTRDSGISGNICNWPALWSSGRVSSLRLVGCGFDSWLGHTKARTWMWHCCCLLLYVEWVKYGGQILHPLWCENHFHFDFFWKTPKGIPLLPASLSLLSSGALASWFSPACDVRFSGSVSVMPEAPRLQRTRALLWRTSFAPSWSWAKLRWSAWAKSVLRPSACPAAGMMGVDQKNE